MGIAEESGTGSIRERISQLAADSGAKYFDSIVDDSWVLRQIDSIRIASGGETRRHTSLDLLASERLPTWPHEGCSTVGERGSASIAVPIALIKKGLMDRLDVSCDGSSLPVLTAEQNTEAALLILFSIIGQVRKEAPGLTSIGQRTLEDMCITAVSGGARYANVEVEADSEQAGELVIDTINRAVLGVEVSERGILLLGQLASLTETLHGHFMLIALLPEGLRGKRVVIKYALDFRKFVPPEAVLGGPFTPKVLSHSPTMFFESCSYHFELDLPSDLHVVGAMRDFELLTISDATSRFHLTWPSRPAEEVRESLISSTRFVHLHVAPASQGIRNFAKVSVFATLSFSLLALWELVFGGIIREDFVVPSPGASVLLVSQALLISWLARSAENRFVAISLKPLRALLIVNAATIFLAAGLLAVPLESRVWHGGWALIFGASVCAVLTYLGWRRANPVSPAVGRTE